MSSRIEAKARTMLDFVKYYNEVRPKESGKIAFTEEIYRRWVPLVEAQKALHDEEMNTEFWKIAHKDDCAKLQKEKADLEAESKQLKKQLEVEKNHSQTLQLINRRLNLTPECEAQARIEVANKILDDACSNCMENMLPGDCECDCYYLDLKDALNPQTEQKEDKQ